jgi:hypothetical protein
MLDPKACFKDGGNLILKDSTAGLVSPHFRMCYIVAHTTMCYVVFHNKLDKHADQTYYDNTH